MISNREYSLWLQVSSRLADLEATLDAGIRHRNKALASVGGHLTKWMDMVRISFWIYSCSLWCSCMAFLILDLPLQVMGILLWTNSSRSYHLVLGKKREGCVRYTEHVKFWCHQKMPCWRGLVPYICKNTGIFPPSNLLDPHYFFFPLIF